MIVIKKTRYERFIAEALLLRAEHTYRDAWSRAKDYDVGDISPPPRAYSALTERYLRLLQEWMPEKPDTPGELVACAELASAIIADQLQSRHREEGCIMETEQDFLHALELVAAIQRHFYGKSVDALIEDRQ